MDKTMKIKMLSGMAGGLLSALFGEPDAFLYGLLFCICADYITGILAAIYRKSLNSRTGFRGILKKIVILILVSLSYRLGEVVHFPALRDVICTFYIANESLSVLENAAVMQIPYSEKLKTILEQLKEKE
ncbi:MAG: phage holin family protein [Clostridia bacterium]|nr:phage holin family protein [Clostridia bacterium]